MTLQDGTQVGAAGIRSTTFSHRAASDYSGPLTFLSTTDKAPNVVRNMGTLTATAFTIQPPSPGVPYDVEASSTSAAACPEAIRSSCARTH